MRSDSWVRDGCEIAERLKAQGLSNRAAEVLRYVELHALAGVRLPRERIQRKPSAPLTRHHRETKRTRMKLLLARDSSLSFQQVHERIGICRAEYDRVLRGAA